MKKLAILLSLTLATWSVSLRAQDTLPAFLLKNIGNNRIVVGWVNPYPNITQLSIQRSFDSLTGYKTILTVPDPTSAQNGYVDAKAQNDHMFYRLYIQLDKGNYLFSKAKKPVPDTAKRIVSVPGTNPESRKLDSIARANPFYVKIDSLVKVDSVSTPNAAVIKNRPPAYTPSIYVFTSRDGYLRINLPDEEKPKKYSIRFFDADQQFLFELKDIKTRTFKMDKTVFYHAGWFFFELMEDGKLLEKHKFYLDKDF